MFLSRPHGFDVLKKLIESNYEILCVYTHALNPRSQDPNRSERSDFRSFVDICQKHKISLVSIDKKDEILKVPECDFIIEVSWRYLIPKEITQKSRIASFGIHRGKLPEYAGAEPIKQALTNNEKEIIVSSHELLPEIDGGKTIAFEKHNVNYKQDQSLEKNIQRLRDEITPLFSKLAMRTLKQLEK